MRVRERCVRAFVCVCAQHCQQISPGRRPVFCIICQPSKSQQQLMAHSGSLLLFFFNGSRRDDAHRSRRTGTRSSFPCTGQRTGQTGKIEYPAPPPAPPGPQLTISIHGGQKQYTYIDGTKIQNFVSGSLIGYS